MPARYGLYSGVVADIQKEIETGADLNHRLSKQFRKWAYVDLMLADFGIHHLHMSLPNGVKVKGTNNPLLYAMFDAENAYVLAVADHHHWGDLALLEIAHAKWPEALNRFKLPVQDVRPGLSPADRILLRRNGIDALIRLKDGSVYLPPGGGLSTDGTSTRTVLRVASHRRALRDAEKVAYRWVDERIATLHGVQHVRITLDMDETGARAIEPVTRLNLRVW